MATYNAAAVSDTAIGFQKPITLQQGRALRDNPLAISEGDSTGAPYMQTSWHPYDGVTVGDGNTGQIWSFAVDGAVAAIETPNFVNGFEYRLVGFDVSNSAGSAQTLQYQLRRQSDAGLTTGVDLPGYSGISGAQTLSFVIETIQPRRSAINHLINGANVAIGLSATQIRNIRLTWTASANFDAGAVFLYRRRTYA